MMPGGQTGSVQSKTCLPSKMAPKCSSACQHSSSFGAQADRFTQFFEMFRLQLVAAQEGPDVTRNQTCLLQRQLRRPRQGRRRIGTTSNVAKSKDILVRASLHRRLDAH